MYNDFDYLTQEEKDKMDYLINQYQIDIFQEFKNNTIIYSEVLTNIFKTMDIYQQKINKIDSKKRNIIQNEMKVINDGLKNLNFKMREMIYQIEVDSLTIEEKILKEIYRIKEERKYEKEKLRPYLPLIMKYQNYPIV
jgi:hypothetical protein